MKRQTRPLRDKLSIGQKSAVEKSSASRTTKERAVRAIVRAISSAALASAFLMRSRANGSCAGGREAVGRFVFFDG
jgi:hypothetical protein